MLALLLASCISFNPQQYPLPPPSDPPYRSLEELDSPKVKKWVEAQNALTEKYLKKIPFRNQMYQNLQKMHDYSRISPPMIMGENLIYLKSDGLLNQPILMIQKRKKGHLKVLIDPNTLSADGGVSLDELYPSHDGKTLAYMLSSKGSDEKEIHIMKVPSGVKYKETLKGIRYSSVAWDKNGFFYCRYDKPTDAFKEPFKQQKIYYHKLGNPQSKDELVYLGKDYEIYSLQSTEDNRYLIIYIFTKNSGKNSAVYLKDLTNSTAQISPLIKGFNSENTVIDILGGTAYVHTDANAATYKINAIDVTSGKTKTFLPSSGDVLSDVSFVGGKFFSTYIRDGYNFVRVFSQEGKDLGNLDLEPYGAVSGFLGSRTDQKTYFSFVSFTVAPIIYEFEISSGRSTIFHKAKPPIDLSKYLTELKFYTSRDGTKVPVFLVYPKDMKRDGTNPTLLYGYGGFNASLLPRFKVSDYMLLEKGGIYAQALLRGGGEYGENWHRAGTKGQKQNTFDDFIAIAEGLIQDKYTKPEKLGIRGASNGGLLVGAVMTQRPDLFAVALPEVGVFDMLRFHLFGIGWNWIAEYGADTKTLYSYSPLHQIKKGTQYPATLILTGDHDDRVMPAHSYKFAAALQKNALGNRPILLRVDTDVGHGKGKPLQKRILTETDLWAFFFCNTTLRENHQKTRSK